MRTLPPDTSEYVEQMRQFQKTEESENCRAEIKDNIEKIGLSCELEVLEPRYTDDFVLKLLYELINKGTSLRVKLPEGVFDMTTDDTRGAAGLRWPHHLPRH